MYKQYHTLKADNENFWGEHWNKEDIELQMKATPNGELMPIFKKYLTKNDKIIEAGCGLGIFVKTLSDAGYDIEGVDFDKKTVKRINDLYPNLNIKVGDVFQLEYEKKFFTAYISLGVIEHYENDWTKPLAEANRILKNGGRVFIAVPYYNWLRRMYFPVLDIFIKKKKLNFYQYLFKKEEIKKDLEKNGFSIKAVEFYGKSKTLMSIPIFGGIIKRKYKNLKINDAQGRSNGNGKEKLKNKIIKGVFALLPNKIFAHMIMIIAEKK